MRIAMLSYRSKPHCGGQGIYLRHLSRELTALGHHVEVFSGQPYPVLDEGVVLTEVPSLDLYREPDPFRVPKLREFRDLIDVEEFLTMCAAGFPEPKTFSRRISRIMEERAGDFDTEGEPAAKRTMRNVSYDETEAFAVAEPVAEEIEAFAVAEAAPENTDVADSIANLLAMHETDFPEGDFGNVNSFDLPQQHQGAPFDFDNFAFADATESDALGFNPDALPSAGFDGDMLLDFDISL